MFGGMPTNIVYEIEKKKLGGGGVIMPKYFIDLKKKNFFGGVCGRMPKHFRDLKKNVGGGGGGGGVMPKY